jgi:isocitrate dehydrogenase (NAD+)
MSRRSIVIMPGDGIGNVVLQEAIRVLNAAGFQAEYISAPVGWEYWCKEGDALPQCTVDLLKKYRIGLFGAITSKPKDKANEELAPELQGKGFIYYSPIVRMRQLFNLDISIRPCKAFPGNPLNFIRRNAAGGLEEPPVDVVIFRQNTEGLYSGVEWTDPPATVRSALETHPNMMPFNNVPGRDLAISTRIFTRNACHRICRAAFEYARKYKYPSVTVCEKPNVIRETSGMMGEEAKKVAEQFQDIQLWFTNIDAQMMWLTKNPEDYSVIVAGNMFGDIISDGFAGLVGGLGFACSANIGDDVAVFEPTHGSAPKYTLLDPPIVNPIAMILAACMMLDHLDETEKAARIRSAITLVIQEGRVQTYDMKRMKGGQQVIKNGAASTQAMTDAIIERL